ncbi:hypothetical protein LPJ77_003211 [Coemansia sp. RSA 2523]|nr:hypothetical protein LPJ54_002784 [Coemansia sp. RSA 1824]KAJ1807115.1 hypothetical protein LPJ77_003211 [Coemansia sp. RSA 2523]KAJ2131759.1 hypothetical protein GGF48_001367 [Coemansia sp. RSA 921]KAJ2275894.1 hypothetical protein EV176_002553 [Coemansia sp. RSA 451]KAJ2528421.1 hypothetical protein IWW43_005423 [Coemansia sp. RSA 1935]KAJ2533668.1 hypothetical protein GGH20_000508 [Coemansia sp. RSA 1937]KAJ2572942.1 hypothetical protein GGH19_004604 [Coemansia sp. RSA 1807]
MAPYLNASHIHLNGRIQQLQTVAVEASNILRMQTVHIMQAQTIRLDSVADTELEDTRGLTHCMDELVLGVLYVELRKDIRSVADTLDRVQENLFCSQRVTAAGSTSRLNGDELSEVDSLHDADEPPMLSARSDTFQTARGEPMVLPDTEIEQTHDVQGDGEHTALDADHAIAESERILLEACMEIDEWRRTVCVREFIDATRSASTQTPSVRSTRSARIPPMHLIKDIRSRNRALSAGHANDPVLEHLGASPPMSRLMQVEQETSQSPSRHTSPHSPPSTTIQPWGQPSSLHAHTLQLLDAPHTMNDRHVTFVDDVRIIGWVTRGSGLDVHTEFKVVVHLSRGENLTAMRRYTDFEVLYDVLCERYRAFSKRIPKLPHKKAFGKFEDRFLKKRESGLQFFLAYVMLHPVIGCSSVIKQWLEGPTSW